MSWHYSQALVAEYLAANCSAGAPSAPLSSTPTPEACSWPGKTTAALNHSPSGTTCAPSTDTLGEAVLTWFLGDSHAKTFPCSTQVVTDWRVSEADSGPKWPASLAKWDQNSCLWKTHQHSLLGGLEEFSGTWPRWGMMHAGECWGLTMQEGRTGANESGLLLEECGRKSRPREIVNGATAVTNRFAGSTQTTIPTAIVLVPTMPTSSGFAWASVREGLLPTPLADDWKGGTATVHSKTGRPRTDQFRHWCKAVHGLTYPIPEHSEAVMGWPTGWTALNELATDKFRQWCASHGISSNQHNQVDA